MQENPIAKALRRPSIIPWVLAAVTLLVFARSATHDFVTWDDELLIYRLNPNLNPPTLKGLENLWEQPQDLMYIPLVYSAWWGLANVGWLDVPDRQTGSQINATPFHLANLVFHLLSIWAVYRICRELFGSAWVASAGALVFAVHPVQVEPVAWATGLKDVLSGALALWAILIFLKGNLLPAGDRRYWRYWRLATALFLLSLLAKPSAVSVPLAALVLARFKTRRSWPQLVGPLIPWLIASAAALWLAGHVQPATDIHAGPLWSRPLIASDALAFYLLKLAVPLRLAIDYCRRPVPTLAAGYPYWTWLLPAVLSWALWRARAGALWVAAAVLVIGVLPVLGLVRFRFQATSTVADRYLYLAMLGPAIAICHVMQRARLPGIISFIIIIALLAVRSFFAVGVWHDSIALYRNAIAVHPESVVAHNNLGSVLEMHGDRQGAIAQWRIALALQPDLSEARDNLRDALSR